MELKSLKDYLLEKGFDETERNTFTKKYKVRETFDENKNFIQAIYKISKGVVFFKMKQHNRCETLRKGALDKLSINTEGEIEGLKSTVIYQ